MIKRKRIIPKTIEPTNEDGSDEGFVADNETDFISDKAVQVSAELQAEFAGVLDKASADALAKVAAIAKDL